MPRLGLRTIKTSVAVYFCIVISTMFGIDPFYSCIAAVSTIQTSIHSSFLVGRDRMLGSTVGAAFGVVFSYFGQQSSFFTALAILCVIYTITLLNSKGSINIACIVVIAIMVDPTVTSPLQSGFQRLVQTLLGIVIAVIVNVTLFPPKS